MCAKAWKFGAPGASMESFSVAGADTVRWVVGFTSRLGRVDCKETGRRCGGARLPHVRHPEPLRAVVRGDQEQAAF